MSDAAKPLRPNLNRQIIVPSDNRTYSPLGLRSGIGLRGPRPCNVTGSKPVGSIKVRGLAVRRINTEAAAKYLDCSIRTLEDWRLSWPKAGTTGTSEQGKGPAFFKVGKRVLYDVHELERFYASRTARRLHCA